MLLDLLLILVIVNFASGMLERRILGKKILAAQGRRPIKEWAQLFLRYSWANEWLSLSELEECFSSTPRQVDGRIIYIFHADFHGVPMDKGLESHDPRNCLGYYTDGESYAKVFTYQRDRKGTLMVTASLRGQRPQCAPHPVHPLDSLPAHWQEQIA